MNARKIFKNCLIFNLFNPEEAMDLVKKEYRTLRVMIFSIMPDGCFLKMWNTLDLRMVFMLSPKMIEAKRVNQKDICALCSAERCPSNDVAHKNLRIIKVKLLGSVYNK